MRYFIGFLVTTGLIIVLIVLLFTGHSGNNGNDRQVQTTGQKPKTTSQLASYADTDVVARLTIDGKINADSNHSAIRITVGREDVTYEQILGYQGAVVNRLDFANNQSAYSNFLYALGRAGFTRGDNNPRLANEKGFCPLSRRYIFELRDGDHDIQRYWATYCGGIPKTYQGVLSLTINLFQLQVPKYQEMVSKIQNF